VHAFDRLARELLSADEVDGLLITGYFGGYGEYGDAVAREELRAASMIGEAVRATGRPAVVHTMYPFGPAAGVLRAAGVPVYESVERSAEAMRRLVVAGQPRGSGVPELPPPAAAAESPDYESTRAMLAEAGVSFVAHRTVTSAADALAAAGELGYPVVLKALGRLHKSDGGGVALAIADDDTLARVHEDFTARLHASRCSVERMAPLAQGLELLIGARWDARFGPVVVAGSGGVYAEVLDDTALALAPAAAALAALSRAAAAHPELAELEVNPLLVLPAGALALDARSVLVDPT
jgi:acyl-CoA synthetase (NDP forming)